MIIGSDNRPGRVDKVTWTVTAFCVVGLLVMIAINGMIDLGAAAHDAFCPEHGWAA